MKVQKTVHYNWIKTLDSMVEGDILSFNVAEIRENSLRSVVSRMKKQGYNFSFKRINEKLEVVCTKRPENKEGAR